MCWSASVSLNTFIFSLFAYFNNITNGVHWMSKSVYI